MMEGKGSYIRLYELIYEVPLTIRIAIQTIPHWDMAAWASGHLRRWSLSIITMTPS